MYNVIAFLVLVPVLVLAVKFWVQAAKWGIENKRSFGKRVQRIRSAVVEASREE